MNFANPATTPILVNGAMNQSWLNWMNLAHGSVVSVRQSGTTANRPTQGLWVGRQFFDTDLGHPVWVQSVGPVVWVDATGAAV